MLPWEGLCYPLCTSQERLCPAKTCPELLSGQELLERARETCEECSGPETLKLKMVPKIFDGQKVNLKGRNGG